MVKRALMIAFHYPPMQGSSGIQRTLGFARHLPDSGWSPLVLSAHARAYEHTGPDQLERSIPVHRSFALDARRHLALAGRYPSALALPDRWSSWWLGAVPSGLRLIRRHRPCVIWSTYPIATAHLIGLTLHRLTGIPWIADQRDPMTEDDYPADPRIRRLYRWIEARTMQRCARVVCTTPGALQAYRARFPAAPAERLALIENGYDETSFARAIAPVRGDRRFTLVHSGLVYPSERDPAPLFAAIARLKAAGSIGGANFRLVLRASGHDDYLRPLVAMSGIGDLVELAPALPYRAALGEIMAADGLLLLQAANCNAQVPAKLYEYLRAARPILALTDAAGDTAAALRACGIDTIAPLDNAAAIAVMLIHFMHMARNGHAPLASAACVAAHSRRARAQQLANLFDHVTEAA